MTMGTRVIGDRINYQKLQAEKQILFWYFKN